MNSTDFFYKMIESLQRDDDQTIRELKDCLSSKNFIFSTQISKNVTIPDPNDQWVQLKREIFIMINNIKVYDFSDAHVGYYGSGGTGWYIEQQESTLNQNIKETFSFYGYEWPNLQIPKPEEVREEFDRIYAEIYMKDGKDINSQSNIDYWVIDEFFVCEPYLGGMQLGELPGFDLKNSSVLRISQFDIDALLEQYFKIHGSYPDT